jgi:curli production assembly/transport component CsgF
MNRFSIGFTALMMVFPAIAGASSMTYTPINPNFGGNPNNASGLMASATAQRQFEKKATSTSGTSRSLSNLVLNGVASQLTNEITNRILDASSQDSGSFSLGDGSTISYTQDDIGGTATVTIVGQDGQITTVTVPLRS